MSFAVSNPFMLTVRLLETFGCGPQAVCSTDKETTFAWQNSNRAVVPIGTSREQSGYPSCFTASHPFDFAVSIALVKTILPALAL